jgi:hypothetical protein
MGTPVFETGSISHSDTSPQPNSQLRLLKNTVFVVDDFLFTLGLPPRLASKDTEAGNQYRCFWISSQPFHYIFNASFGTLGAHHYHLTHSS